MKTRTMLIALLALAAAMPAVAQKKGIIYYDCKVEAAAGAAAKVQKEPVKPSLNVAPKASAKVSAISVAPTAASPSPNVVAAPKENAPFGTEKLYFCYEEGLSLCLMPGLLFAANIPEHMFTKGVSLEGEPVYRTCAMKPCSLKSFDCKMAEQLIAATEKQDREMMAKLTAKFYQPTEEVKDICGMKARRYNMEGSKAVLWVAEEMEMNTWFAPFWGMNHPVLEFSYPLVGEDGSVVVYHMIANKISEDFEPEMLKETLSRCEPVECEDVEKQMQDLVNRSQK